MSQTGGVDPFRAQRDNPLVASIPKPTVRSVSAPLPGATPGSAAEHQTASSHRRAGRPPSFGRRLLVSAVAGAVATVATACSSGEAIDPPVISPVTGTTNVVEPTSPPTGVPPTANTTAVSEVAVIPGLDSTNTFCRAWSRFSGSYTIVAPAWYVSEEPSYGIDVDAAGIEVAASQTMVAAYFEMGQSWPDAIAAQKEAGMASYDGLFQRSDRSLNRLKFFGATPETLAELAQWWETQLPLWDGNQFPVLADVPPSAVEPLTAAAGATKKDEAPFSDDPSLQSEPVPEVYEYLQQNCPDEGLLAGNEGFDG